MSYVGRKKYYIAEQERLVECAETLRNIFSQDTAVGYLPTAKDVLREMVARIDTWERLLRGEYSLDTLAKVRLSSLYGECVSDAE